MLNILTLNKSNITDFAKERNELLKNSKTEWNLFLDADEKLSKPINNISNKYNGYYLKRKNYFLGHYVGSDKIIRLGKRKFTTWKRSVHEIWDIKRVGKLDNFIIHNTADDLSNYIKKINKYSDLHAKANLLENKKSSLFKIIFFPVGKFIITLIKSKHVVFSIIQSFHSYLSWTKLYFLQH